MNCVPHAVTRRSDDAIVVTAVGDNRPPWQRTRMLAMMPRKVSVAQERDPPAQCTAVTRIWPNRQMDKCNRKSQIINHKSKPTFAHIQLALR